METAGEQAERARREGATLLAGAARSLGAGASMGELVARVTEHSMALNRLWLEMLDITWQNWRLAGRQDVVTLRRQLARSEERLEEVLEEIRRLRRSIDAESQAESDAERG